MEELEKILREHAVRYPQMQPTDAVKLIYQNEFGGGHLVRDASLCLRFLRQEFQSVTPDAAMPPFEEIGNGIVRVNLAAMPGKALEQLAEDFMQSAAEHRGSEECFFRKLEILQKATMENTFSFSSEALDTYLAEYRAAGCPAVSHSKIYAKQYHPAYRIITKAVLLKNGLLRFYPSDRLDCIVLHNKINL